MKLKTSEAFVVHADAVVAVAAVDVAAVSAVVAVGAVEVVAASAVVAVGAVEVVAPAVVAVVAAAADIKCGDQISHLFDEIDLFLNSREFF